MNALLRFLCAGLTLSLTACSSFERDWRQAGTSGSKAAVPERWEGRWTSAKHRGAGGRLRCVLQEADARQYRAQFRANWLLFTAGYTVPLNAERRGDELRLNGAQHIGGIGGGVYRYEGRVTRERFHASYHSSYDHGTFEMVPAAR